jgi:hypothetical protein
MLLTVQAMHSNNEVRMRAGRILPAASSPLFFRPHTVSSGAVSATDRLGTVTAPTRSLRGRTYFFFSGLKIFLYFFN